MKLELVIDKNSKRRTTATTHCLEEIGLVALVNDSEDAVSGNNVKLDGLVYHQTVNWCKWTMPATRTKSTAISTVGQAPVVTDIPCLLKKPIACAVLTPPPMTPIFFLLAAGQLWAVDSGSMAICFMLLVQMAKEFAEALRRSSITNGVAGNTLPS